MRLGIISDLHLDLNDRGRGILLPLLAQVCREERVEMLLLAGDLANNYRKTIEFLHQLEELAQARCLFVPGNHDIWNLHHQGQTAWEIYQSLQSFSGNLAQGPVSLPGDWVVIGDIGWYDYSFGSPAFSTRDFDAMEYNQLLWQDGIFANWGQGSKEVSHLFLKKLQLQLEQYQNKKIILMTHIVPHVDFTVHYNPAVWQYFNAFLGSGAYGELAEQYKVKYYVFGHVHFRLRRELNGVTFICNSLGYTREWRNPDNPRDELRRAMITIEI